MHLEKKRIYSWIGIFIKLIDPVDVLHELSLYVRHRDDSAVACAAESKRQVTSADMCTCMSMSGVNYRPLTVRLDHRGL